MSICCTAFNTNLKRFYKGDIKYFNMKFRKKNNPNKSITIPKSFIKINKTDLIIVLPSLKKVIKQVIKKSK
jgi:hypothetical protein